MPYKPPKIPPKPPNSDHWKGGRKWPPWKDENRVWNKRSKGLRTKPWNKVPKRDKFWTFNEGLQNALVYNLAAGSNNAVQICEIAGSNLTDAPGAVNTGIRALEHAKLHRIQGYIWAWLAPLEKMKFSAVASTSTTNLSYTGSAQGQSTGNDVPSNICMMNYVWLKLKTDANVPSQPVQLGAAADFNPNVTHDLTNLMQRDDILAWGTIPVFGIVPRMYTLQPATGNAGSMMVGNAGMYLQNHVAKVLIPRMPKEGLNLKKGEVLACFVAAWPGPGDFNSDDIDDTTPSRKVVIYPCLRFRCSI